MHWHAVHCGEEKAECEAKAVDLLVDLLSDPHLKPRAAGSD